MKNFIVKILLLLTCMVHAFSNAQIKNIDSLKLVLQNEKEDSNKVNSLLEAGIYYNREQHDATTALQYENLALEISKKISFLKGEAYSYVYIGGVYYNILNKMDDAIKYFNLALNIFKKIDNKTGMALCYKRLGIAYQYTTGNWPEAIKNTYEAIKLYEESVDKKEVALGHTWIGLVYYWNDNYDQAYTSLTTALQKYDQIGHDGHDGECYIYIANIYKLRKKYEEALKYDSIGLKMAIEKKDKQIAANAY